MKISAFNPEKKKQIKADQSKMKKSKTLKMNAIDISKD